MALGARYKLDPPARWQRWGLAAALGTACLATLTHAFQPGPIKALTPTWGYRVAPSGHLPVARVEKGRGRGFGALVMMSSRPANDQMSQDSYTDKAWEAIARLPQLASKYQCQFLDPELLFRSLLEDGPQGLASRILFKAGAKVQTLESELERHLAGQPKVAGAASANKVRGGWGWECMWQGADAAWMVPRGGWVGSLREGGGCGGRLMMKVTHTCAWRGGQMMGTTMQSVLNAAFKERDAMKDKFVSIEHLLLGLVQNDFQFLRPALSKQGVDEGKVREAALAIRGTNQVTTRSPEASYEALEQYSRDLTQAAKEGKLDPVIGRDDEIRRTIQILSRRTKNNPILLGEPGVGKTAIAEGLAQVWRRGGERVYGFTGGGVGILNELGE
jgi:ATP-dependent Clp protease ATP-binding subunit ClpB